MTHTRRLQILATLPPNLMLTQLAKLLKCKSTAEARKICDGVYAFRNGRGAFSLCILADKKKLKYYQGFDWTRSTTWLCKHHKLSRQMLSNVRQQLDFRKLFLGTKKLSYEKAVKEMRSLQDFRLGLAPSRRGRRFKDLKVEEFRRWARSLGVEIGK